MEDTVETYSDGMVAGDLQAMFAVPEDKRLSLCAEGLLRLRLDVEDAENALAVLKKSLVIAEDRLLQEMDQNHVTAVTVEGDLGHSLILEATKTSHYRLLAGALDDHSVMTWLLRNGGEDLVERRVNAHVFSGFCRSLAKNGQPIHKAASVVTRRVIKVKEG